MTADVKGYCPACGSTSLFLGSGGYVTCSVIECPRPDAVSTLLEDRETEHIVTLREGDFTIRHPLRERLDMRGLEDCALHAYVAGFDGPPLQPGRYRVSPGEQTWAWADAT